ncbi:peptidoglycan recognition family protein [Ktedonospora formicarum]|uniref:N-acetylmuramoyl-L-alanine amidase n=1 Tax=Ktedonospora formicarum TaxID=2778364 RepID=A0A8J3I075_9CHLR|nr:peptidoglycan recognition family protein [Ktedonospora formicarum]GHO44400.1 hypothetical protein KSX_25630 [Ktedonospora formicarum]
MVDEAGAVWIPSPNYFENRNGYTPKWVIVHGTAGFNSARDVGTYFQTADVSANYVIGQDGTIVQCVAEKDGAWGNGVISTGHDPWWTSSINPNWVTISIEHVKPHTDNSDVLTDAQKAASFRLISHICARYKIPLRRADANGGITGHYSMDPVNRSRCPGPYPWDELISYLNSGGSSGGSGDGSGGSNGGNPPPSGAGISLSDALVARYFEQASNGRWRCKTNGFYLMASILNFYCQFGGSAKNGLTYLGLPLMNEFYPNPGSQWSYQRFERGILAYDPTHHFDRPPGGGSVYLMHIDQPLPQGTGASIMQQAPHTPIFPPSGQGQQTPYTIAIPSSGVGQQAVSMSSNAPIPISGQGQQVPSTPLDEPSPEATSDAAKSDSAEEEQPEVSTDSSMPEQTPVYKSFPKNAIPRSGPGQQIAPTPVNKSILGPNQEHIQYQQNSYQHPDNPEQHESEQYQPNPYRPGPQASNFPSLDTPPPKSSLGEFISGAMDGGVTAILKRILSRK